MSLSISGGSGGSVDTKVVDASATTVVASASSDTVVFNYSPSGVKVVLPNSARSGIRCTVVNGPLTESSAGSQFSAESGYSNITPEPKRISTPLGKMEAFYDGYNWVIPNGPSFDSLWPEFGTELAVVCGEVTVTDLDGNEFTGNYRRDVQKADGFGGYYVEQGSNDSDPCFYPGGYVKAIQLEEDGVYTHETGFTDDSSNKVYARAYVKSISGGAGGTNDSYFTARPYSGGAGVRASADFVYGGNNVYLVFNGEEYEINASSTNGFNMTAP